MLKTHQGKRERIDKEFAENIKKLHPDKSFREATKELNKVIQEMLYGPKSKKK